MRITDQSKLDAALSYLQTTQNRLQTSQQQATSGQKVTRPSDDPVAWNRIAQQTAQLSRIDGYGKNINQTRSQLSAVEASLQSIQGVLTRLREVAMMGVSLVHDPQSTADEAGQLQQQLLSEVNASFGGQYLYAGYAAGAPFSGGTFAGDNQKRAVEISPLGATQFGISAQDAFGVLPGQNVFSGLTAAITGIRNSDRPAIEAGIGAIDGYMKQLAQALTQVGAQQNTLTVAEQANQSYTLALNTAITQQRDVNQAQAYSTLAADQYAVQATYSIIGSSSKLSILQYI